MNSQQTNTNHKAIQSVSPSIWAGFYKKTIQERQDQLKLVFPQLEPKKRLPLSVAVR
jgi:hypothetical protein